MVAHVALIILRRRCPAFPRSSSPEMTWTVYTNTGLLIGAIGLYAVLWTTFRMKKNGFAGEPLAQVLGANHIADPERAEHAKVV